MLGNCISSTLTTRCLLSWRCLQLANNLKRWLVANYSDRRRWRSTSTCLVDYSGSTIKSTLLSHASLTARIGRSCSPNHKVHGRNLRGYDGTSTPTFWTGVPYPVSPLFRTKRWRICCHLLSKRRSVEIKLNKTVFGRGSAPDLAGRAHDVLTDTRVGWGGKLPPHSPPLSPRDPRAPRSTSELIPHFLDQSYAPTKYSLHCMVSLFYCYLHTSPIDNYPSYDDCLEHKIQEL